MNTRYELPLSLLASMDEQTIEGRTRLQKLLFLIQQEAKEADNHLLSHEYEFIPYDYGPFSKEVYDDIDGLVDRNLVSEEPQELDDGVIVYHYELTEKGRSFVYDQGVEQRSPEQVNKIAERFGNRELGKIIDYVYDEYPEYAKKSVLR